MLVLNYVQMVLAEVSQERLRQHDEWGEQNHAPEVWLMILGEEVGEATHAALGLHFPQYHRHQTRLEWLAEYRKELIQVAAVTVAMVESLDRNELARGR